MVGPQHKSHSDSWYNRILCNRRVDEPLLARLVQDTLNRMFAAEVRVPPEYCASRQLALVGVEGTVIAEAPLRGACN